MKRHSATIFLFLSITGMATLCVSCGSSRTGFAKTATGTHATKTELTERTTVRTLLYDLSSLRTDTLHMQITEYYPPPEGDTTKTGPVKSETTIRYGATTVTDSSAALAEQETETGTTLDTTTVSHSEESQTTVSKTVPWYARWQIILLTVITAAIIIYCILRRTHIM